MTPGVPAKMIASVMGLGGFTLAIICGLAVDNPTDRILSRAILSMFVCNAVGMVLGLLAERTVIDAVSLYKVSRPVADQPPDSPGQAAHPAPHEPRSAAA